MAGCCDDKSEELAVLREQQRRVLYVLLVINAVMFVAEFTGGWIAHSTALLGDSLDMLGDASVYAVTLYFLYSSERTRAGVAVLKGVAMLIVGLTVLIEAARRSILGELPDAGLMSLVGLAALVANAICFALLYRHRSDDLNLRSTWLCTRNDLFANAGVIAAAGAVAFTSSLWPDLIVGVAIAALFIRSAQGVLREAWGVWRAGPQGAHS